jgi:hypothetical protein
MNRYEIIIYWSNEDNVFSLPINLQLSRCCWVACASFGNQKAVQIWSFKNQVSIVQHLGGAELAVPVFRMAAPTSAGLQAPALGLAVQTNTALAEGYWQTSWLVERQLLPARNKEASRVVVASRAMLAWQEEGATQNQVSAFHLPARPTAKEQQTLLRWLAGPPIRNGKITLPDGQKGTWLMTSGKQQGRRVLAITWGLPPESGFFVQYVALRSQQNAKKDGWKPALLGMASRFQVKN